MPALLPGPVADRLSSVAEHHSNPHDRRPQVRRHQLRLHRRRSRPAHPAGGFPPTAIQPAARTQPHPTPCSSSTTAKALSRIPTAQLKTLHSLGINIFAFDYRGFGQSLNTHPSETRTYEDADAAWNYLTDIRHLDPRSIILYGAGLGATIAAETALRHHESPALILENPAPPALSLIAADERTSILPIRLLFRDRFEIGPKLDKLGIELSQPTQAIVLSGKMSPSPEIVRQENPNPSGPKFLLFLGPKPGADPRYLPALRDFLAAL